MQAYEKLGLFYLGRRVGQDANTSAQYLLYDSKDLVTHAVCVGMTGSGKTGLCIALLEEAAIDGIPALVDRPKGDLGNLLLTFPRLAPADFRPWIDADEARRARGSRADEFAAAAAGRDWKKGLAEWGQDGDAHPAAARRRRLRDLHAGQRGGPAALGPAARSRRRRPTSSDDAELMRERVATTATSLLGLLGIDADPMQEPRAHPAVARCSTARLARRGRTSTCAALIQQVQKPPVDKVGVLELEAFYPAEGALRARDGAQQPARRAGLRRVD